MSCPRVKPSDLTIALESSGMEDAHISRFDREPGEMAYVKADVLRSVAEDPEYDGNDLPDWQRKEVETARALLADDGTRFTDPPGHGDDLAYTGALAAVGSVYGIGE